MQIIVALPVLLGFGFARARAGAPASPPGRAAALSSHTLRGKAQVPLESSGPWGTGAGPQSPRRGSGAAPQGPALQTFAEFYEGHVTGRGIWKWQNALEAYQKHWAPLAGRPVRVAEVGVQSGGSMLMWRAVFGSTCHIYGLDINPKCLAFQDASTTITIGDQGDPNMWQGFFSHTCTSLDILVDDGGHEAHQMVTTFNSVFPRLNPGGYVAIEDIHGAHYLESFFKPTAQFLEAHRNQVASIHVYPFLLMVKRSGQPQHLPATQLSFQGGVAVSSFDDLWRELRKPSNRGGHVVLENPLWGHLFTAQALSIFFSQFNDLHASSWFSLPAGCASTAQSVCTNTVFNTPMQDFISGYHIYPTKVVVEVPSRPPVIRAVRKGTEWITYS